MDLYSYIDYRKYLKDYLSFQKTKYTRFSFRFLARISGFNSPGFLKMVMDGQRNLSPESINKLVKGLKLNKKEGVYFEALVFFNQAQTPKDKDLYFERLSQFKPSIKIQGIQKDQYEYFTQKHYVILREMVALPHFKEDPVWIAQKIKFPIKPKDIEHALEVLTRLGLIKRNEAGKLVQAEAILSTSPEVNSMEVANFHRSMLDEAKESILDIPPEFRHFSALTIPIPKTALPEIKSRIEHFREEIMSFINQGKYDFFEVYQMNVQFFPVTKTNQN